MELSFGHGVFATSALRPSLHHTLHHSRLGHFWVGPRVSSLVCFGKHAQNTLSDLGMHTCSFPSTVPHAVVRRWFVT